MKSIQNTSPVSTLAYLFLPEDSREDHYSCNEQRSALRIIKAVLWLSVSIVITIGLNYLR